VGAGELRYEFAHEYDSDSAPQAEAIRRSSVSASWRDT
jgi:hypothetical protein